MADTPEGGVRTELARELNLFHLTMMGLGMMIGAGVFLGIGNALYFSGPGGVILTFALNGVIALFTAMSYAELSSAIPRAGGALHFARLGFGKGMSFLAGWMEWFASSIAGSMYAITFAIYVVRYLEQMGFLVWIPWLAPDLIRPLAILIAALFLYINYRGVSETGKMGALMTLGQMLFLVLLGAVGVYVAVKDPERLLNLSPFMPRGWGALLITMGFTYVAFEGYEVIAQAGDEAIDPKRNLPKAMIYSVVFATATYVLVSFAAVMSVKAGSPGVDVEPWLWIGLFREQGFGEAISRLIPYGNLLLTVAVIFASTSALNATIFSAARAAFALGRGGMLPAFFARVSASRKTPWGALTMTGLVLLSVAAFLPTMDVASSASIMFLLLFFLVNVSVIRVRWRLGDELEYGYIMPFFPVVPLVALILQGILAVWIRHMSKIALIIAPSWILLGVIVYFLYARSRALPSEHDVQIIEELDDSDTNGNTYRVMIPVSNTDNALHLAVTTTYICRNRESQIRILHMLPVPGPLALEHADAYMAEGKKGILKAAEFLKPLFPITTTIRYCRNVARGIISTVREKRIDLLIMGWHGTIKSGFFSMGSILDPVLAQAPCDIVILKDETKNKLFHRALVPVFGRGQDRFAVETAMNLLHEGRGEIALMFFRSTRIRPGLLHQLLTMGNKDVKVIGFEAESQDPAAAMVAAEKDFDLLVWGIGEPRLYSMGLKGPSERITESVTKPFVLVKTPRRIEAWTKQVM